VAFAYYRYSYAAAFSVVIFLILLGVVVFSLRRTTPLESKS
jgi:ABC-type sugar transport system permease subunit